MAENRMKKLRFWCQCVLPLVYDDSLSYMEVLNKVVVYLNNTINDVGSCETNIEALLESFIQLQDYVNSIAGDITPVIEDAIEEMIESGQFGEILSDVLDSIVAEEYDSSNTYITFDHCIYNGKYYRATANTTGEFDSSIWTETLVGNEIAILYSRVFGLNAGQVNFNSATNYDSGTVGSELKSLKSDIDNLTANDIAYNSQEVYNNATVGKAISELKDSLTSLQTLNILVIGNSFNQDIFAYVPKLLEDMMPNWKITFCVLYTSSATISQHLSWFSSNTKYTWTNMWYPDSTAWARNSSSSQNGLSLYEALNLKKWDMIFTQGTTNDAQTDAATDSGIIVPARKLLRTLQAFALGTFDYYTIEWLARGADVDTINSNYDKIHRSIIRTMNQVGFADYIPVGTAIQSARTNNTLNALGTGVSMLYSDNVHIQAGQPALICANTVAAFIAKKCSEKYSLYKASFSPTTANAIAINAKPADSDVGMTHGESLSATTHVRRATQEIAYFALTNPNSVVDCSNIIVTQQSAPS